jgi:hypothetical protein
VQPLSRVSRPGRSGPSDFDFVLGSWQLRGRRRRECPNRAEIWDEYVGTSVARPLWGGLAQIDEYAADGPAGHVQWLTLRLYDPRSKQWTLFSSNRSCGTLDKPILGEVCNGRGEFYDLETHEGRSVYVRYSWSQLTAAACRCEQAVSMDGGKTWDMRWVMDMTRSQ